MIITDNDVSPVLLLLFLIRIRFDASKKSTKQFMLIRNYHEIFVPFCDASTLFKKGSLPNLKMSFIRTHHENFFTLCRKGLASNFLNISRDRSVVPTVEYPTGYWKIWIRISFCFWCSLSWYTKHIMCNNICFFTWSDQKPILYAIFLSWRYLWFILYKPLESNFALFAIIKHSAGRIRQWVSDIWFW